MGIQFHIPSRDYSTEWGVFVVQISFIIGFFLTLQKPWYGEK